MKSTSAEVVAVEVEVGVTAPGEAVHAAVTRVVLLIAIVDGGEDLAEREGRLLGESRCRGIGEAIFDRREPLVGAAADRPVK